MKRILLVMALALGVSGCAQQVTEFKNAVGVITSSKVSTPAVVVTASAYDALEVTAANYVRLKRCTGNNGPVCSNYAAVQAIKSAFISGRQARDDMEQFLIDHPGELGPSGLYDALKLAVTNIENVFNKYNVRSVVQ